MKTQQNPPIISNDDRRGVTRRRSAATVVIGRPRNLMVQVPVIECTEYGARVVLNGNATQGEDINVVVKTDKYSLIGEARVAWTSPLSNGRAVAGLEFLNVTSVL